MSNALPKELSPETVRRLLAEHAIVLIDVREPQEYAAERIHGALLFPLSTFDPGALPLSENRPLVFHCGSGKRSATALARSQEAGPSFCSHMTGGLLAWKSAGFPTVTIDPASGAVCSRA